MRAFLDTNVVVYAVDVDEPRKRNLARTLLDERSADLVISAQVLSEFYAVVTRRFSARMSPAQTAAHIETLSYLPVIPIDADLVRDGIAISREAHLSYWDGLIVAAARTAGCGTLLTEDLSDGAVIAGLRIENPFAG